MAEKEYKYRLHELFAKLPHEDYYKSKAFLCQEMGISDGTLKNWIYSKNTPSGIAIPGEHLISLANFFQIEVEEILTTPKTEDLREKYYELHSKK